MKWLFKLKMAIAYIEQHLDSELSYDEAAKIACCSVSYFGRMFSYVAGIPLSEYVRRRKMTQAAFELQSTNRKVLDIALQYGYRSPTAFNRAFQQVHGITPVSAKEPGTPLNAYPPLQFSVEVSGGEPMPYRIEEKGPVRIAGILVPLKGDPEESQRIASKFWHESLQNGQLRKVCALMENSSS